MNIQLLCETKTPQKPTALFAEAGLTHDPNSPLALVWTEAEGTERWELRKLDEPKLGAVFVDLSAVLWRIAANLVAVAVRRWQKR